MPIRGKGGKGRGGRSKTRRVGTVPGVPTGVTATDVGTNRAYNNGAVTVTFTAASDGSTPATSYTASGFCSVHNTTHTVTGASSPLTITGFGSGVSTTITVKANNQYGSSADSSPSSSVTVTTVPAAPAAPTVTSAAVGGSAAQGTANTSNDTVSWSAPANGGKAITGYSWTSSDGKSGNTASTSVTVGQESGTSQTYNVYATNANGNSATSSNSGSITSAFSFTPFSVFGFSPFSVFGFSPFGVFGFSPFGFSPFGFSPFGVFGFSPFGFSPFGFSPFGFSPFGFSPFSPGGGFTRFYSLAPHTKVRMADGTLKEAQDLTTGDVLLGAQLPGMSDVYTTESLAAWTLSGGDLSEMTTVPTTINRITTHTADALIGINGDAFSPSHLILVKRDGVASMKIASDILESDLVWTPASNDWQPITELVSTEYTHNVININCEPYDLFFTENALTHDGAEYYLNQ